MSTRCRLCPQHHWLAPVAAYCPKPFRPCAFASLMTSGLCDVLKEVCPITTKIKNKWPQEIELNYSAEMKAIVRGIKGPPSASAAVKFAAVARKSSERRARPWEGSGDRIADAALWAPILRPSTWSKGKRHGHVAAGDVFWAVHFGLLFLDGLGRLCALFSGYIVKWAAPGRLLLQFPAGCLISFFTFCIGEKTGRRRSARK